MTTIASFHAFLMTISISMFRSEYLISGIIFTSRMLFAKTGHAIIVEIVTATNIIVLTFITDYFV